MSRPSLSGGSAAGSPGHVSSGLQVGDAVLCPHPAQLALALGRDWHGADSDSKAGLQGGLCKGPNKRCLALTGKALRGIEERGRSTSGFNHKSATRLSTWYSAEGTAIPTGPPPRGYVGVVGRRADTICLWTGSAFTLRPESNATFDLGPDMLVEGQKRPQGALGGLGSGFG